MKQVSTLRLPNGKEPFIEWISALDAKSRASIFKYIERVADGGAKKNVKYLGDHVFEIKIDRGPGFRVYFGEVGKEIVLILIGGDKSSQEKDIVTAKKYWRDYVSK